MPRKNKRSGWRQVKRTKDERGMAYGYRSGLEETIAAHLQGNGIKFEFESIKVPYVIPESNHTYNPDFLLLKNGIIVETKGRFISEDRKKHILIKLQHPNLDIRFVFSNSNNKISKGSKTTYKKWCETNGFIYADKLIPKEWILEPLNELSLNEALLYKTSKEPSAPPKASTRKKWRT